jgi:hypothetical protein
MLRLVTTGGSGTSMAIEPAREAVVSWNSAAPAGRIELSVLRSDGARSGWLPYATWNETERRSLSGRDEVAGIELDVLRAPSEIVAIDVRADAPLDCVAVSTPFPARAGASAPALDWLLDVPQRSQYVEAYPEQRGWCSPAVLSMLLSYWDTELDVAEVARRVLDRSYDGTGNWAFNVALAGSLGLRGVVTHLRDLASAERIIAAGIPLALSISWKSGELPGAPLDASDGHLIVLCGFGADGAAVVNDPAQPAVRASYARVALERAWLDHGGIAYVIAPCDRDAELLELVNG